MQEKNIKLPVRDDDQWRAQLIDSMPLILTALQAEIIISRLGPSFKIGSLDWIRISFTWKLYMITISYSNVMSFFFAPSSVLFDRFRSSTSIYWSVKCKLKTNEVCNDQWNSNTDRHDWVSLWYVTLRVLGCITVFLWEDFAQQCFGSRELCHQLDTWKNQATGLPRGTKVR